MIKSDLISYRDHSKEKNKIIKRHEGLVSENRNAVTSAEVKIRNEYNLRLCAIRSVDSFVNYVFINIGKREANVLRKLYILKETASTYTIAKACEELCYSKSAFHSNVDKWIERYNREYGLHWLKKEDTSL